MEYHWELLYKVIGQNLVGECVYTERIIKKNSYPNQHWDRDVSFTNYRPVVFDLFEGTIALNVSYTIEGFSIYGGPAVQYLNIPSTHYPPEVYQVDILGYVGGSLKLTDNVSIRGEYQFGQDHKTISSGLAWKF